MRLNLEIHNLHLPESITTITIHRLKLRQLNLDVLNVWLRRLKSKDAGRSPNAAQQRGAEFEEFLVQKLGGKGSFKVTDKIAGTREFDGAVGNVWYEAKSGQYWDMLLSNPKKMNRFKTDMGKGIKIAQENGASYAIHSNVSIPQSIKDWLTKNNIPFTEW